MPVITGLKLKNFRVFKEETSFEFAPITVLTGANNSGKSSVLKALLLMDDNTKRNGNNELDFTGEYHKLGSFDLCKNNQTPDDEPIGIEIKVDNMMWSYVGVPIGNEFINFHGINVSTYFVEEVGSFVLIHQPDINLYWYAKYADIQFQFSKKNGVAKLSDFNYSIEGTEKNGIFLDLVVDRQNAVKPLNYWFFKFKDFYENCIAQINKLSGEEKDLLIDSYENHNFWHNDDTKLISLLKEQSYELYKPLEESERELVKILGFENESAFLWAKATSLDASNFLDNNTNSYSDNIRNELAKKLNTDEIRGGSRIIYHRPEFYTSFYHKLHEMFIDWTKAERKKLNDCKLTYIEPVRVNQQRLYTYQSQGTSFNKILHEYVKWRAEYAWVLEKKPEFDFLKRWIGKEGFDFADAIEIVDIEGVGYSIKIAKNGKKIDLSDLGFGIAQVLSIIMKLMMHAPIPFNYFDDEVMFYQSLKQQNPPLVLLEEPEINLHPNFQALLADMLIDAQKMFGLRFIVETHSEYFIRRLQVLTADKTLKPEDTALYYFYTPGKVPPGREQVERIRIEPNGALDKPFGEGFYDMSNNLAVALYKINHNLN